MRRNTALAAMMAIVLANLAAPALAQQAEICGGETTQEAYFVDGGWQMAQGPLATLAPVVEGLAWEVLAGANVDYVQVETAPAEVGDAVISAAQALPGGNSGLIALLGDGMVRVTLHGSIECPSLPTPKIHEDPIEAFAQPRVLAESAEVALAWRPRPLIRAVYSPE